MTNTALSETGNERIRDGGNLPPAFDAHKANIDDIRDEASTWLDGKAIESADEAEAVNTLLDMARKARKAADDARAEEKKPHLDAAKAVDATWQPLIKLADMIADVCKQRLTPWNIAEKQRKDAEAARIRAEAEEERRLAEERMRESSGDIEARHQAEQTLTSAKMAEKIAKKAEKEAGGAGGLRTTYRAEIADFAVAARHFWQPYHDRFEALVLTIAQEQVRAGRREIPGVRVVAEKKAV